MTTDRDDIASLLAKVKAATGPDRELDFWVETLVANPLTGDEGYTLDEVTADFRLLGPDGMTIGGAYTASIDAALRLVERLYPGEGIVLETHGINRAGIGQSGKHPATGATPPLAILTSLLSALLAAEDRS